MILREVARPIAKNLHDACAEFGFAVELLAAWDTTLNALPPTAFGYQGSHKPWFRCSRCSVAFQQEVKFWLRNDGRGGYTCSTECQGCTRLTAWDGRRRGSIPEVAETERACRALLIQWADPRDPGEFRPTEKVEVEWRCARGHRFKRRINSRYVHIRRLTRAREGTVAPDDDGTLGCDLCSRKPSWAQFVLLFELADFLPGLLLEGRDDVPAVDIGGRRVFPDASWRPDGQPAWIVEYDGFAYHGDRRDDERATAALVALGFIVVRLREDGKLGVPQDEVAGAVNIPVPQEHDVPTTTAAILTRLIDVGRLSLTAVIARYLEKPVWRTRNEAMVAWSERRAGEPGARVFRLLQDEPRLEAELRAGASFADIARREKLSHVVLMTWFKKLHPQGLTPSEWSVQRGLPLPASTTNRGNLATGEYDAEILRGAVADVCRRAGVKKQSVQQRRKWLQKRLRVANEEPPAAKSKASAVAGFADDLGRIADSEIARSAGVGRSAVAAYRRSLGIPPVPRPARATVDRAVRPTFEALRLRLEAFRAELGVLPDRVIAEKAGVSCSTVYRVRTNLGIAPWRHTSKSW